MRIISILFGQYKPITPRLYLCVGLLLMLLKYAVDATSIYFVSGSLLPPWLYILPIATMKFESMNEFNPLWLIPYILWTLMFIWIGASMTYRRLQDASKSPYLTILFFVPFINYFAMVFFSLLPSQASIEELSGEDSDSRWWLTYWGSAIAGTLLASFVVLVFSIFSVFILGEYGLTLFAGLPFVNGFVACALFNHREKRSLGMTIGLSIVSVCVAALVLILFAFEGVLCVAMLAPFAMVLAAVGGALAWYLIDGSSGRFIPLTILLIPLLAIAEPKQEAPLREVQSSVIIEAPPSDVWNQVVTFNELPPIARWFFKLGIAYPIQARLVGEGVGAIRYCEFSTGPFVEPITHWEAPVRLSFDVTEQPATMEEWSFYEHINAPHITESLKSRKGEFRLIELENGHTRLEGSTWYTQDLKPYWYWYEWSDFLIHAIHTRVLEHIKAQSEQL